MYSLYCRIFQIVLRIGSYVLPWRKPEILEGAGSLTKLPSLIKRKGLKSVLIVTGRVISSLGLMDEFLEALHKEGIAYTVYDRTVANPTIDNIEEGFGIYREKNCRGIIAFGGGSPMDCAKGIGVRVARPRTDIRKLRGVLKVWKRLPPLFAVPTTAGTGSETTLAAVITDARTHEKFTINDMPLIPHYAVLDPLLTVKLPSHITSTTGIDALTHAVEAYIGKGNTRETREFARTAVKLIFENIFEAWSNGANLKARENMLKASHYAGIAFTRAYVGYVHAMAHTLGGMYSVPHGLANAVILPYVLDYYGKAVEKPLSELADIAGITAPGDDQAIMAKKFIEAIRGLNERMNIPTTIDCILEKDLSVLVRRALKEANPLYPVPRLLFRRDLETLFRTIRTKEEADHGKNTD